MKLVKDTVSKAIVINGYFLNLASKLDTAIEQFANYTNSIMKTDKVNQKS